MAASDPGGQGGRVASLTDFGEMEAGEPWREQVDLKGQGRAQKEAVWRHCWKEEAEDGAGGGGLQKSTRSCGKTQ